MCGREQLLASATDTKASEDFHLPNHTLKKKRREENRRQRIITGNARPGDGPFRGASELVETYSYTE